MRNNNRRICFVSHPVQMLNAVTHIHSYVFPRHEAEETLFQKGLVFLVFHGFDIFYHPMNKGGKGAQRLFEGNTGLIYPDFISRDNEARIIADAKYKPIENIGNRDYLQVLAYMFRFDAKVGFYLYPEAEDSDDLKLRLNQGSTYESNVMPRDDISITKHGLKVPADAADYDEFVAKMKSSEKEFIQAFSLYT